MHSLWCAVIWFTVGGDRQRGQNENEENENTWVHQNWSKPPFFFFLDRMQITWTPTFDRIANANGNEQSADEQGNSLMTDILSADVILKQKFLEFYEMQKMTLDLHSPSMAARLAQPNENESRPF